MATPAIIVVVSVALLSLVVLAVTVLFLVSQVQVLTKNLRDLQDALAPTLRDLDAETSEIQRRLEQVATTAAQLRPPKRAP